MEAEIIKLLEQFDYKKQLLFAYLTCERLYPNYVYFSKNFNFGDSKILREAIDFIYNALLNSDSLAIKDIPEHLREIDINTPFPHHFQTIIASSALDACTAIMETINFIVDKKANRLIDISTFATDTVDMYIGDKENLDFNSDPEFENKIANNPLMKRELNIQTGIITYLSAIDKIELLDINYLLHLQFNDNKSNIDL
jgi:uncharacterized protein YjaG (DUF416 family)